MAKKQVPQKSKRRLALFGTLSVFIIFYFVYSLITYAYQLKSLSESEKNLEKDLVQLKANETDLKSEIQKLQDPDYVARYARENYLYSKNGEYIIKINPSQKNETSETKENIDLVPIYVGCGIVVIILIIYILIRGKKKPQKEKTVHN